MPKGRELLIILILAVLVSAFLGYFVGFPLRIIEPIVCIQMIGARCTPKINWLNTFLDFLFWFLVLVVGWWVAKWIKGKYLRET